MFKVGLTGGIASGKSTVCRLFSHYGIPIIDADVIARQLVEPGQAALKKIARTFGNKLLRADGSLNRHAARTLIFSDSKAKQQLENILHPQIRQQLVQQSEQLTADYCILAIPLLIEANMEDLVDRILIIDIEPELQLQRLCERDNLSSQDAQLILNHQCDQQQRLTRADDVINNSGPPESLAQFVDNLHKKYCKLAQSSATSCQQCDSQGQ